ncbi:hypothetical protein B4N89_37310 [Embleya scabrispora]|uniref:Uncharacterized protein n=1 Tax=Embleya scabrispora TaxID=159449 RepID=A0A1T3NP51_9ACTN|nr:hypothetical protein B4N89_37310 [Embleya scabrispora]
MVSLTSWTFETRPDDGTGFGDVVQGLATTDGLTPRQDLRLRVPVTEPGNVTEHQREALDRIAGGATTLPQRLPTGERTIAFHRGPFTALKPQPLPDPGEGRVRLDSSGEALVYLEKYGVFDTSYAAAFTAGRTLALADADYRKALLEFRRAARFAVRRLAAHPDPVGRAVSARHLTAPLAIESFDRMLRDDGGARLGRAVREAPAALRAGRRRTTTRAARTTEDAGSLLADAGVRSVLREAAGDEFVGVRGRLDRLRLLETTTFDNLVPDSRMLPQESIRFFHVDPQWIRAAVDGALSIGVGHALDADLNSLALEGGPIPACGVLIRSSLIPGWPTTIHTGLRNGVEVEPLRTAVYGTDVRLVLFPVVIDRFEIAEPPRGICFGIGNLGTIELREIEGDEIGHGKGEFPADRDFGAYLRDRDTGVLNICGPGTALLDGLEAAHGGVRLSSARFALQMIQAPQVQSFIRP